MSEAWLAEIRCFPYNKIPSGWHLCDGTILQVTQNAALYSLLGTQYGGVQGQTFALPDLRGRVPVQMNQTDPHFAAVGRSGGSESITLTAAQMPMHIHTVEAVGDNATTPNPLGSLPADVLAQGTPAVAALIYGPATPPGTALFGGSVLSTGGSQAHENRQPTVAMNWCICTAGYYPPRN